MQYIGSELQDRMNLLGILCLFLVCFFDGFVEVRKYEKGSIY